MTSANNTRQRPRKNIWDLSDEDLLALLQQHQGPNGIVVLDNDSEWHRLPADRREMLAQRLMKIASQVVPGLNSTAADAGQLAALLERVASGNRERGTPSDPGARTPESIESSPPSSPPPLAHRDGEVDNHTKLVQDGGRPAYPLDLVDEVCRDPVKFHEMLRPWLEDPDSVGEQDWDIIWRQRERWEAFRRWQRNNRGMPGNEDYSRFKEDARLNLMRIGAANVTLDPDFEEATKERWNMRQAARRSERKRIREIPGVHGFSEYSNAVKRRLEHHGFTEPFQLERDPRQQETWTMWVEYLSFECWWLDKYIAAAHRSQSRRSSVWAELQKSGLLEPSDTEDNLLGSDAARQRQMRVDEAARAVTAAQEGPIARQMPADRLSRTIQSRLDAANRSLAAVTERNRRIAGFAKSVRQQRSAEKDVLRQTLRLEWIREQLRQIEDELKQSSVTAAGAVTQTARGTKRKRATAEEGGGAAENPPRPLRKKPRASTAGKKEADSEVRAAAAGNAGQPPTGTGEPRRSQRIAQLVKKATLAARETVAPPRRAAAGRTSTRREPTQRISHNRAKRVTKKRAPGGSRPA